MPFDDKVRVRRENKKSEQKEKIPGRLDHGVEERQPLTDKRPRKLNKLTDRACLRMVPCMESVRNEQKTLTSGSQWDAVICSDGAERRT
jgi:hypothetical protein